MTLMSEFISYETAGKTATITLRRPDKRNALNAPVVTQLQEALDRAEADEGVRVVILTGEGNTFSAGADLEALQGMQSATFEENAADSRHLARLFRQIYLSSKPVIARVNGHAIAGGCGLAAVCDFSVVAQSAKLGFTEVRIGFVPAIVMVFVLRKLGETTARRLLLTGTLISAAVAESIGLVSEAVPDADLDTRVEVLSNMLASETSGTAISLTKQMIASVPGMGLSDALDYASQMNALARSTDDCLAGISAFLEKKDPPWRR